MRLAVNIDHIATIREARKAREPEPVTAAVIAELAGAEGITVHLRGDRRHIKDRDVELLRQVVQTKLNVEMAATAEMVRVAHAGAARPGDARARAAAGTHDRGRPRRRAQRRGAEGRRRASCTTRSIRVSAFIDCDARAGAQVARRLAPTRSSSTPGPTPRRAPAERREHLERLADVARLAARHDLEVLAGHGLNYVNVKAVAPDPRDRRAEHRSLASSRARRSSVSTAPCAR